METVLHAAEGNPIPDNHRSGFFTSHDGLRLRYAIFKSDISPAKGTVVLVHGRSESIEKYFETIRDLTAAGLWVATFDLRGQGLSDRTLLHNSSSPNRFKGSILQRFKRDQAPDDALDKPHGALTEKRWGHVRRFSDYERDLELFLEQVVLPDCRLPLSMIAHSTGGLIALATAPRLAGRISRLVLSAPFVGLHGEALSAAKVFALARLAATVGLGNRPLSTTSKPHTFATNVLTSDAARFERNMAILAAMPELSVSAPSARWLHECAKAIRRVNDPAHLTAITIPTLLLAPMLDGVVPFTAQEHLARHFRAAQLLTIAGARHELLQEQDRYREQALAAIHAFIPGSDPAEQWADASLEPEGGLAETIST